MRPERSTVLALAALVVAFVTGADQPDDRSHVPQAMRANAALLDVEAPPEPQAAPASAGSLDLRERVLNVAPTVTLFALVSLIPAALLMATAFVRISIVLTLLRQALGSPQVPGNQVLMALALLLTALVMKPKAELVYERGIAPFASGAKSPDEAWRDGTQPLKGFMIDQIVRTHHEHYLQDLYDQAEPADNGQPPPEFYEDYPLHVVAPAFLISELTTALFLGFAIYLPFLVIDLVVASVLASMGLIMLPPSLVAMPLKLMLFVLADGWMLVSGMLLRGFA
jgi:flagellar biosynthetic protein FliP